eukprot:c16940_g1_i1.p1 GENE.c16940_g1_i1~~c16940_g1_i1.p1  ORF type:complete len:628 (-),score=263.04 c16940_g1_i1:137-2020(-)
MEAKEVFAVLEKWKNFDLDGLKPSLDEQAVSIADAQEASLKSRKQLAEETKEFKKNASEELKKGAGNLLKQYQEEIDSLTKRSKNAETSFLTLYRKLFDVVDPVHALQSSIDTMNLSEKLEKDKKNLKEKLEEMEKELNQLTNQEITLRKMEEKIASFDSKFAEEVEKKVQQRENIWKEKQKEDLEQRRIEEAQLRRELATVSEERNNLSKLLNSQQIQSIEREEMKDKIISTKEQEIKYLTEQFDIANERLSALQQQQSKADKIDDANNPAMNIHIERLRVSLQAKQEALDQSCNRVLSLTQDLKQLREEKEKEKKRFEEDILKKTNELEEIRSQLNSRPTTAQFEELSRELATLKAFEYGVDLDESLESSNADTKQLSILFANKARKLEQELVTLKSAKKEMKQTIDTLNEQLSSALSREEEAKSTIKKVEKEVELLRDFRKPSDLAEIMSGLHENSQPQDMVQLFKDQRDRFRQRVKHLEEENASLHEKCVELSKHLESLQEDNIRLYEKMRFVRSYPNQVESRKQSNNYSRLDVESGHQQEENEKTEQKYKQMYEKRNDPFAEFSKTERSRSKKNMNFADKIIYETTIRLLEHKQSRMMVLIYIIFVHLILFFVVHQYRKCHY